MNKTLMLLLLVLVVGTAVSAQKSGRFLPRPRYVTIYNSVDGKLIDKVYSNAPAWKIVAALPPGKYTVVAGSKINKIVVL